MNKLMNAFLVFYSFILSILAAILLYGFVDEKVFSTLIVLFEDVIKYSVFRYIFLIFLICIIGTAIWTISYTILSGRLSKTRIRQTDIGNIDIGVDAIESIALNSAKSAQVGIKSAKAHVSSGKEDAIRIYLNAVLYSNVEVPAMMAKVQERIKKDIERYTGISVEYVSVKVSRVEPIVAKVER